MLFISLFSFLISCQRIKPPRKIKVKIMIDNVHPIPFGGLEPFNKWSTHGHRGVDKSRVCPADVPAPIP